ncbi:polysaccharide deacetylase family protein [Streptomyces sp. NPDC005955]|uniref:polysaccharide deacetylase family protein n=1 Tax=Streptomyces sp. NPDC005955 TaxID=3364738 RepID=UPI0036CD2654
MSARGRSGRRVPPRRLAALLVAAALAPALTGCTHPADRADGVHRTAPRGGDPAPGPAPDAHRRWGLTAPLTPAPRPARPGGASAPGAPPVADLAPVIDRVPTRDPVVFLIYGDGVGQDPRFGELVRDLRLPVTVFLTDRAPGPGHAELARLRPFGVDVQNHTLDHPYLPGLPYVGQRAEICGQRDKLHGRFGIRPDLLRPPHGAHDRATLRAAADCGMAAVVTGRPVPAPDAPLNPGDVLVADPPAGTSATTATLRLLRRAQARGLAVARLTDYV